MSEAILWGIRAGEYGDLDRSDVAEYHHVLLASMKQNKQKGGENMGSWTSSNPCKNCGKKSGIMVKCSNCGTLGCPLCVRSPGKGACKLCKKVTDVIKVQSLIAKGIVWMGIS